MSDKTTKNNENKNTTPADQLTTTIHDTLNGNIKLDDVILSLGTAVIGLAAAAALSYLQKSVSDKK